VAMGGGGEWWRSGGSEETAGQGRGAAGGRWMGAAAGGGCGWGHGEEGAAAGLGGNELGFGMRLLIYFANAITVVESAMNGWK
jgi:hypothetical protein